MTNPIPNAEDLASQLVILDRTISDVDGMAQILGSIESSILIMGKALRQFRKDLDITRARLTAHQQ